MCVPKYLEMHLFCLNHFFMVAILDHRNLATSTKSQHLHYIYHMRKPMCRHQNHAATSILSKVRYIFRFLQVLAAAILDHHYLSAQNKMQCFHCIRHMRKPMHRHQNDASTLIISKVMFDFLNQILVMAILDLCKLKTFPKVATLARGGFGFWKP